MSSDYENRLKICIEMFDDININSTKERVVKYTEYVLGELIVHSNEFIGVDSDNIDDAFMMILNANPVIKDLSRLRRLKYGRIKEDRIRAKEEMMRLVVDIRMRLQDTLDEFKMRATQ